MSRIPLFFWGLVAVVSAVWFAADSLWVSPFAYFPFRSVFVQYSGVLAVVMMAVALLLALVKAFPYHLFRKTHKLLAVVFLPLAWHSFILMEFDYWAAPIGWLTQAAVVAGSVAAVLLLVGWPGKVRKVPGEVVSVAHYPDLKVFEFLVKVVQGWSGHSPGQFAFITSDAAEGPLTPEEIRDAVPDWQNASLWYCGPVGLANTLFNQFRKWGMPAKRMHREFFDMR